MSISSLSLRAIDDTCEWLEEHLDQTGRF
jgi:hypothetical protein